jgi:hypothetical protein
MDNILEEKALLRGMIKTWGSARAAAEALVVPYSTLSSWLYDKDREVPPWVFSALSDKSTIAGQQITIAELTEKLEAAVGRNVVAAEQIKIKNSLIMSVFPNLSLLIEAAENAVEEDAARARCLGTAGPVETREALNSVIPAWQEWGKMEQIDEVGP